ncbi:hypothetical protein GYH30_001257 [Glycine max]|uniref:Uncharacterized protein n=1 Tax=Glycine max TaxID=3847 RepID=A0A0R0LA76_SOYBN|nr:hypothetical protein GYH30_001257 [Glycine max]
MEVFQPPGPQLWGVRGGVIANEPGVEVTRRLFSFYGFFPFFFFLLPLFPCPCLSNSALISNLSITDPTIPACGLWHRNREKKKGILWKIKSTTGEVMR